ncbi:MAG: hypothetical protein QOD53_2535 [Thermoleophilaceae bacterium]|nr:hypothetical protein [Thermoleophilaceae bacterium]
MNDRYLAVYLNDHHAGSVVGVELSKRAASSNEGSEYGRFLSELAAEIAEDRASLERIMERFGVKEDKVKSGAAFVGEKLGRLKPNAQLTGYSPLSRVVELEGLTLGVSGKLLLWRSLRSVADSDQRLDPEELDALIVRAEAQQEGLEQHRLSAVAEALTG